MASKKNNAVQGGGVNNPVSGVAKKNTFLRGLAVLLPTLIIIFILTLAVKFLYGNLAAPLGKMVLLLIGLLPAVDTKEIIKNQWVVGVIGFPLAVIIIFFIGTFLGRAMMKAIEQMVLYRFPVVRSIYPYAKQFAQLIFSEEKKEAKEKFKRVVAVEYPRQGVYQLAFVTSDGLKDLDNAVKKKTITVFLPTSPAPFTGWTAFVPADEVIPLSVTVDEAVRMIVSGGVLIPEHQLTGLRENGNKTDL